MLKHFRIKFQFGKIKVYKFIHRLSPQMENALKVVALIEQIENRPSLSGFNNFNEIYDLISNLTGVEALEIKSMLGQAGNNFNFFNLTYDLTPTYQGHDMSDGYAVYSNVPSNFRLELLPIYFSEWKNKLFIKSRTSSPTNINSLSNYLVAITLVATVATLTHWGVWVSIASLLMMVFTIWK